MLTVGNGSLRMGGATGVSGPGVAMIMADDGITLGDLASFDVGVGSELHFSASTIAHDGETVTGLGKVVFDGGTNQWMVDKTIAAAVLGLGDTHVINDGVTLTANGEVELNGGSITGGVGSKLVVNGARVVAKEDAVIGMVKIELLYEGPLLKVEAGKSFQINADSISNNSNRED
ncbi:MAG: hypothetical protein R3C10_25315 [Pirellulales bacterium]